MARILRKITLSVLAVLAVGIAALAYTVSYETPCGPAPAITGGVASMKAAVRRCYGPPDVIEFQDVAKPVPADDQLLVRVHAASINPADWHEVRGEPYLMRMMAGFGAPKDASIGTDFSGTVEAVGKNVTKWKPGDAIFGGGPGTLAEYIVVKEQGSRVPKPANLSFEDAGGVYIAALTAYQALKERGDIQPGDKVLINGASGGVGTFAVQIAKAMGAEVTGVCSTRNVELVRSLGADHVIDYKKEDFTESSERYDVVMDNVATRGLLEMRRVLKPGGKHIIIGGGGPETDPWIGALWAPIKGQVISWFVDEDIRFFLSHASQEDLAAVAGLLESGKIRTVVDRRYPLAEAQEAFRYLESGRARGKVIIDVP